jgi:hypothetical protein
MYEYFKETAYQWFINCEKGEDNNLQNENLIKSASEILNYNTAEQEKI